MSDSWFPVYAFFFGIAQNVRIPEEISYYHSQTKKKLADGNRIKRRKSATINANLDLVEWFSKAYLRRLFIPVVNRILRPGEFHVNDFFFVLLQHCMNVEV